MIVTLIAIAAFSKQALRLPALFSDNMVLQRNLSVPFFGTANPSEAISVQLNGQAVSTKAGPDGKWIARLQPMQAGGPYMAVVQTQWSTLSIKNVMVGEVWVCSGQSNMEMQESAASDYVQAQEEANPSMRTFTVGQSAVEQPLSEARGQWVPASKYTVGSFSAVALAFGRELQSQLNVPVGLITAAWGGTRAESWISRDTLSSNETLKPLVDAYLEELKQYPVKFGIYRSELKEWAASRADTGNEGFLKGWENRLVDESTWNKVNLPGTIETMEPSDEGKPFDGAAWFRKAFTLPDGWGGKALQLELGSISDYDDTYVNGTKVGFTKATQAGTSNRLRSYRIAPGILLQSQNVISVRVYAAQGACGFTGMAEQMRITLANGNPDDAIPLGGEWKEKVERKIDTTIQAPHIPLGPGNPKAPGSLFNGMISPLMPYGIKGTIWYQGESNVGDPLQYRALLPTLIRDWRQRWNQGQFPFYFVQLPNYHVRQDQPDESDWAELREAQASALKLSNTGMANAIDLGDASTIHPKNKREVGRRLAQLALSRNYSLHTVWSGPEFHYLAAASSSIRVFFQHVEDGLRTNDGRPPIGFAIAGEDHRFYWANATIQGDSVVLSSPDVSKPIAVRYAWADNPDCNLYNSAGLPTIPFRTDNWPTNKKQP